MENPERSVMTLQTKTLPPQLLAFWIRTLRAASNLSQDALAEASGVSERTIQRVESKGTANKMTRRSLARGFRYDNHDIFDDPTFISTASSLVTEIHAERAKKQDADQPDHFKLAVEPVSSGAQIAGLIHRCDAWAFHCDDAAGVSGRSVSTVLFDNIMDDGDIWSELSPSERFEASEAFTEMLNDIASQGLRADQGLHSGRFAQAASGQAPQPFDIGYLAVILAEQAPSHIPVTKRY
jgi:transcriptional regulator with XRE-family HTH domain